MAGQHLEKYKGAVIAVTHDRYFLDHVAGWIAEVDRGRLYRTKEIIQPIWKRSKNVYKFKVKKMLSWLSV